MNIIRLAELETFINPHGFTARRVYNSPEAQVMNLLLKSGEVNPPQAGSIDMLFYVIKGRGKISIGDEEAIVGPTDIVLSPKNVAHGVFASEGEDFHVLVIKTPSPQPEAIFKDGQKL